MLKVELDMYHTIFAVHFFLQTRRDVNRQQQKDGKRIMSLGKKRQFIACRLLKDY